MKTSPYSLQEARELAEEYQYLIKQPFAHDSNAVVENVIICPFDEASRKRFLIFYFLFNNAEKALAQEYKGLLFDVLVIGRSMLDEHELQQEDLYSWLKENKGLYKTIPLAVAAK
ncbi:MAG: hypothetical protein K0Q79_1055 [Flavipsychrobacter sp.]|jgi:hypothetical protein|nr:hypothetical protein [Flavipsychrobacter sp.]